jgi:hypothetical protein
MVNFILAKFRGMVTFTELQLGAEGILQKYLSVHENELWASLFRQNAGWKQNWVNWIAPHLTNIANAKNRLAQKLQIRQAIILIQESVTCSEIFGDSEFSEEDKVIIARSLYPKMSFEEVYQASVRNYAFSVPAIITLTGFATNFFDDAEGLADCSFYDKLLRLRVPNLYRSRIANAKTHVAMTDLNPELSELVAKVKGDILQGSKIDYDIIVRSANKQIEEASAARDQALIDWPTSGSENRTN